MRNNIRPVIKKKPSNRSKIPSREKPKNIKDATSIANQANCNFLESRTTGRINTVIPRTSAKFATLEPITFPIAIPELPLKAAFKLTISSGADVPKETTVTPIKKGEMFNFFANEAALLTKKSPPINNNNTPTRSNKYTIRRLV